MSTYQPRTDVLEKLHGKTLVMVVGPTSIGKSFIMNEATTLDARFTRVSGLTTRQPRPNDEPGLYRYISDDMAARLIADRQLVQYIVHPTTGKLYGTEAEDFPGEYNLQDTLSTSVDFYRSLPFARHYVISLTTEPGSWKEWFLQRYPAADDERTKRLLEAKQSIEWSLSQTGNHVWLVNRPGRGRETASQLIEMATGRGAVPPEVPQEAGALLRTVEGLLS